MNIRRLLPASISRFGATAALTLIALLMLQSAVFAQQTGQITGTVMDQTGAAIPNAKLVLTDQATKATRSSSTNGVGFFTFSAVMPGNYDLKVEAKGFKDWSVTGIHMSPGDKRDIAKVEMSTGATTEVVTVEATATGVDIVSSPEKSATITAQDIERQSTVGRNALELLRLLPGMSVQNWMTNKPAYDPNQQAIWNSPLNNYGMNGMMPGQGGVTIATDGAQILDVGNMGATLATVNMDMVSEVKVQTSNFSADTNHGPVVVNAVGKSGTDKYHGSGYLYARHAVMNSNDWFNNNQHIKKPEDHYYYPGGNIGGPVKIPGTNLDKKMFFFAGAEVYRQMLPANDPIKAKVPTDGMRNGDFSWASMRSLCERQMPATVSVDGRSVPWAPFVENRNIWNVSAGPSECKVPTLWWNVANGGSVTPIGAQVPSSLINPAGQALMNFLPHANATPDGVNGYSNFIQVYSRESNSWQLHPRVDYNFNDSNKLYFTYNRQHETSADMTRRWWAPQNAIVYPGQMQTQTVSNVASVNYMRVFSPTLTSETVLGMTRFNSPEVLTNPQAVARGNLAFPDVFNNGAIQIPAFSGDGLPNVGMQSGLVNNQWSMKKSTYSFAENITKVFAKHTLKVGGSFERAMSGGLQENDMAGNMSFSSNADQQAQSAVARAYSGVPSGSTCVNSYDTGRRDAGGNAIYQHVDTPACFSGVANLLFGWPKSFSQDEKPIYNGLKYKTFGFYATDNWKATKRLTLDLGLRVDYMEPWTDTRGIGTAVFDPELYAKQVTVHADRSVTSTVQFPGMKWHAMDPSVPVAGTDPHRAYISPRLGLSWDIFGTSKWVLRGGYGSYYFQNQLQGALVPGQNQHRFSQEAPTGGWTFDMIRGMAGSNQLFSDNSASFVTPNQKQPRTDNWNFTISHPTVWNSFLEVSYVGNRTAHLMLGGKNSNVNNIPLGAFYNQPWPTFSWAQWADTGAMGWWAQLKDAFRPYSWYSDLTTNKNIGWANYHSLQVSWNRSKGWATYGLNYTFSKAMGIYTDTNPFDLASEYGPLNIDRTHMFNASYSFDLGNRVHGDFVGSRIVKAAANGWQLSGITQVQSGPPLQALKGSNLGFGTWNPVLNTYNYGGHGPNSGSRTVQMNSANMLGTTDVALQPMLKPGCDPTKGHGANSYFNTDCWIVPNFMQNGPVWKGYFHSPAFFSSDLTMSKNFRVAEKKNVQFKASAFNVFNHPLPSFNGNDYSGASDGLNNLNNPAAGWFTPGQQLVPTDFLYNTNGTDPNYVGKAPIRKGNRLIMLGIKFEF